MQLLRRTPCFAAAAHWLCAGGVVVIHDSFDEGYAVVWRDNSAVHLMKGPDDPTGIHLFQWIRDVDSYHAEITARGAKVTVRPSDTPYGTREFTVLAPGGLPIVFGQDVD